LPDDLRNKYSHIKAVILEIKIKRTTRHP